MANGRNTVSPLDYGLNEARNGEETYYVLLKCHQDAVRRNCGVSYAGINDLFLEIPINAMPIPLTYFTDFAGVSLIVKNTYKNLALFSVTQLLLPINTIKGVDIDSGNLLGYPELSRGKKLLVIEDENPWVVNRRGYSYGAIRRDVLLVTNGRASNRPVMSYGTPASKPKAAYCDVSNDRLIIKNLSFIRESTSSKMTMLVDISNLYNVEITNIYIETPSNDELYRDAAIRIKNCVKVTLNDITINGTYSLFNHSGYGVSLNNIYNLRVNRMYAHAKWGVFGNYNVNKAILQDSDINRFDVHSYGRDFMFNRCNFSDCYNQIASVYGNITFNECVFENQIPFLQESTFNAFTPFELMFKNCVFYLDKKHNYIITLYGVPEVINERHELGKKCLPNIVVNNCDVHIPDEVTKWYLIQTRGVKYKENFDYIRRIILNGIKLYGNDKVEFDISDELLSTEKRVRKKINFK